MTEHRIINANSNNMSMIPDGSVQLIVTSPPYPMIEMWDEMFIEQDKSIKEVLTSDPHSAYLKMHNILNTIWQECDRVLSDNGFICVNIGDATRTINNDFQLFPNHAQIIEYFTKMGYCVLPDIHWRKQSNSPNKFMGSGMYPAGAYVTYEHEYILIFRKGGKRIFDGEKKNARRKSAYFWEERNVWFSDLWDIKGTGQLMQSNGNTRSRNASFPFEIPYRLVNMYSVEGDTVLDPFCGLGTTLLACMASNRNSIGIEIDPEVANIALKNVKANLPILNERIQKRLVDHSLFVGTLSTEKKKKCYTNEHHQFLVKTRQETEIKIQTISGVDIQEQNRTIICQY